MRTDPGTDPPAATRYVVTAQPRRRVPERLLPAIDTAARLIELRYAIRVPGAPTALRIIDRASGDTIQTYRVTSTDGVEAQLRADLATLSAEEFALRWANGHAPVASSTRPKADARRRLRADARLIGGIAALALVPLLRRLWRRHRH